MISSKAMFCAVVLSGMAAFAARPIATVSSAGSVRISGVDTAGESVAFWPLASGDVIQSLKSNAVLVLPDKSRITLSAGSKARIETNGTILAIRVLFGGVDYRLSSINSAQFFVGSRQVQISAVHGSVGQKNAGKEVDGGSRRSNPPNLNPGSHHPPHPSPDY